MSRDEKPPAGGADRFDDIDRRFSEIVAHLQNPSRPATPEAQGEPGATEQPPLESHEHPARERGGSEQESEQQPLGPDRDDGGEPSHTDPAGTPNAASTPGPARWREADAGSRPDPADDHFIPPDPPPLPAGDLHFWAILAGLTLGPLVLLLSTVIPLLEGPVWEILGVVMSVAGFVLLVLRSPRGDDDWGAQV